MDNEDGAVNAQEFSSSRVSAILVAIRDGGLHLSLFLLLCFPLLTAFREFIVFLSQDPAWGPLLSFVDAGGQRPLGRSVLRVLLAGGCLSGLLLPLPGGSHSGKPWAGLFLLAGIISVALSGRVYSAETEWETWALILLFAVILRRARPKAIRLTALTALYLTCLVIFLHALWLSVPVSTGRIGGVFHHANALSTFTLFVLPFLLYRARTGGLEGFGAAFLSGAMLAVQLWAGSLSGACVLVFGLFFWLLRDRGGAVRWGVSTLGMALPIALNLAGGYFSTLGFLALFLALVAGACWRLNSRYFGLTVLSLLSLLLCSGAFSALAPTEVSGRIVGDRSNSIQARLHFYQAAVRLTAESPLVGQGPSAFPHEYPRYQESIQFFSRFVHSIPLEVLLELGLLGFLALTGVIHQVLKTDQEELSVVFRWAFVAFALHCLSGVQTQFPYLLLLPALAWAVVGRRSPAGEKSDFPIDTACRLSLSAALLALLTLNFTRVEAALDQSLASQLYRSGGEQAKQVAHRLFQASLELEPGNGQYLLTYAQVRLTEGSLQEARALAAAAIDTDHDWAAPRRVELQTRLGDLQAIEQALAIDPVNYPDFYRMKAELLSRESPAAALELLRSKAEGYHPIELNRLPEFRAEDLEEQLVEYWLLIALLEEKEGRSHRAEAAFRKSLFFTRRLVPRYRRMIRYPLDADLRPGPVVGQLLAQLGKQLPAE